MTDETCDHCDPIVGPSGEVLHRDTCPVATNLYPITEEHVNLVCPGCGAPFRNEEFYTTVLIAPDHPIALEIVEFAPDENANVLVATCLSCAATNREIPPN